MHFPTYCVQYLLAISSIMDHFIFWCFVVCWRKPATSGSPKRKSHIYAEVRRAWGGQFPSTKQIMNFSYVIAWSRRFSPTHHIPSVWLMLLGRCNLVIRQEVQNLKLMLLYFVTSLLYSFCYYKWQKIN